MLNLGEIKNFLKIDFPDDDSLLSLLNKAAAATIKGMTGFDMEVSDSPKAKIVCLAIINEMYKDRGLTAEKAGQKIRPIYEGILIQLSHEKENPNG